MCHGWEYGMRLFFWENMLNSEECVLVTIFQTIYEYRASKNLFVFCSTSVQQMFSQFHMNYIFVRIFMYSCSSMKNDDVFFCRLSVCNIKEHQIEELKEKKNKKKPLFNYPTYDKWAKIYHRMFEWLSNIQFRMMNNIQA